MDLDLQLQDASLVYQTSRGPLPALGPLDLNVADGEFLAVLGPSGCGKSTLLKTVSGLLPLSSGTIKLGGVQITKPRPEIGLVFQQPNLLPWKNVYDNIVMPTRLMGTYGPKVDKRATELLDMVGLASFARHYVHELSGGMQQRVGIARGLIHEPRLLLMDEPFAALDALTREQMTVDLQQIWNSVRNSVIFITHSIQEAVFLADRIVVLSNRPGRIIHTEVTNLPRPRSLDSMSRPEFIATCDRLRRLFTH